MALCFLIGYSARMLRFCPHYLDGGLLRIVSEHKSPMVRSAILALSFEIFLLIKSLPRSMSSTPIFLPFFLSLWQRKYFNIYMDIIFFANVLSELCVCWEGDRQRLLLLSGMLELPRQPGGPKMSSLVALNRSFKLTHPHVFLLLMLLIEIIGMTFHVHSMHLSY